MHASKLEATIEISTAHLPYAESGINQADQAVPKAQVVTPDKPGRCDPMTGSAPNF